MSKKRNKFVDPRTPVSVTHVGKWTVTIYDQDAYEDSFRQYPDDNADNEKSADEKPIAKANNFTPQFKKQKQQARYNWTTPLKDSTEEKVATSGTIC